MDRDMTNKIDAEWVNSHWDDIADELQHDWTDITEDELENVDGNIEKLYGMMQEKYGKSRDEFDDYLENLGG